MHDWDSIEIQRALNVVDGISAKNCGELPGLIAGFNKDPNASCFTSALSTLDYLFVGELPFSRGVYIAGGTLRPHCSSTAVSVTGTGFSQKAALVGLCGEIREALAIYQTEPDLRVLSYESYSGWRNYLQYWLGGIECESDVGYQLQAVPVAAPDSISVCVPEVLCKKYHSISQESLPPLSEGCASNLDRQRALDSALCERVERHAIALWWYLKRPAREASAQLQRFFQELVEKHVTSTAERVVRLLDISLDWGPVVLVVLSSSEDGSGLTMGFGCHANGHAAVQRALLEQRQMEFGLILSSRKRDVIGEAKMAKNERNVLLRAEKINVHQDLAPVELAGRQADTDTRQTLASASDRGVQFFKVALSSAANGVAVVKVVSPQLYSPVEKPPFGLDDMRAKEWAEMKIQPL